MKKHLLTISCLLMIGAATLSFGSENMMSVSIGPTWPRVLLSTGTASWDVEACYGIIVDKKIGVGICGNFLWNSQAKDIRDPSGHYMTISDQSTFMFPIMGYFMIDPMPKLPVRPAAHFALGYNSMIYNYTQKDSTGSGSPVSPYFYGLIVKTGVDAVVNVGEQSALIFGLEYRWADTKNASNTAGLFDRRNMGGIELRGGFRVIL
jgi:hypothetical protein